MVDYARTGHVQRRVERWGMGMVGVGEGLRGQVRGQVSGDEVGGVEVVVI